MARKKNLKIVMNEMLNKKLCIGQSRAEAKKQYKANTDPKSEGYNNLKAPGIYSVKTANNYREVINMIGDKLRSNYPEIWKSKEISLVDKEVCYSILREREAEGKSPYTISRDLAALNKVLGLNLTKKEGGLSKRSYKLLTRSRNDTNANLTDRLRLKNQQQIIIAKATGIRRQSMKVITPDNFVRDRKGNPCLLYVVEKGGRERFIHILEDRQKEVKDILDGREIDKPLFDYFSRRIDNHSYRAEYAESRYLEIIEQEEAKGHKFVEDYRDRYDAHCLRILTQDLGHNRINVCAEHYLDKA
ncbi:MAG: hypothetical protein K9L62_12890 [Vallitaleaceae bacterium]|nr:hypothetical protein [Vallitaleaceae bacterium]